MYKHLFQNSKAALLFAGITLFGAVSMVGTSEESGVLTKAVDLVGAQRDAFAGDAQAYAEGQSVGDTPPAEKPVFGEFSGAPAPAANGVAAKPAQSGSNPMTAPMSPTAVVSHGTPASAVPFISDREMTIEPE